MKFSGMWFYLWKYNWTLRFLSFQDEWTPNLLSGTGSWFFWCCVCSLILILSHFTLIRDSEELCLSTSVSTELFTCRWGYCQTKGAALEGHKTINILVTTLSQDKKNGAFSVVLLGLWAIAGNHSGEMECKRPPQLLVMLPVFLTMYNDSFTLSRSHSLRLLQATSAATDGWSGDYICSVARMENTQPDNYSYS